MRVKQLTHPLSLMMRLSEYQSRWRYIINSIDKAKCLILPYPYSSDAPQYIYNPIKFHLNR